jgi:CheY-like chemotaxis protein
VFESMSLIRPLAAQRDVEVSDGDARDDYYVLADRQRLTQVLLNLLSNAVKYNRKGGTVTVALEPCGPDGDESIRIHVRDTGIGIAPARMDQLFPPFERLGAEQSEVEGTGLGLALSQRLVEAMGGTLEVESEQGVGSTFTVELPRVESPVQRLAGAGTPLSAANGPGRAVKMLYIEDNLANLSLIETILAAREEVTLLPALQGQLGLDLAWEHDPDLILLDLHLPDMPGEEVLRRLRADARTRHTPIVVITADATVGRSTRLLATGATAYMTKPLDIDGFLALVDRTLRGAG